MGIRPINKDADPDETPQEKKEINVYIGNSQRVEGQIITFNVGITDVLEHDLLVDITTLLNGSAESEDFNAVTGQVKIVAGATVGYFHVQTNEDDDTDVETFGVAFTENYTYSGDDLESLSFSDSAVGTILEGNVPGSYKDKIKYANNFSLYIREVA